MPLSNKFFTTEQVTRLLGLKTKKDEWRVIKFAQSKEYGIKPSVSTAAGSGSRRLYDVADVCQLALALRLLETGLRSKKIGKVLGRLRKRGKLSTNLKISEREAKQLYIAIVRNPQTRTRLGEKRYKSVSFAEPWELDVILENVSANCDVIMVPVGLMFLELRQRLEQEEKKTRGE